MAMLKTISILLMLILIVNIVLFALGRINPLVFWLIIVIAGLIAYKGLPLLKK